MGCGGATGRGVGVAMTDGADVGGGGLEELLCRRAGAMCKVNEGFSVVTRLRIW